MASCGTGASCWPRVPAGQLKHHRQEGGYENLLGKASQYLGAGWNAFSRLVVSVPQHISKL